MENNLTEIKMANKEIKGALEAWQEILNIADADEWAFYLEYDDVDLFNALYIFNHVAQNKAIKNGFLNADNAEKKMLAFKDALRDAFGFDSVEITQKSLEK